MAKLLDGKVIAITGAGGGLGRAYALYLAKEGARVVVNDLGGSREGSGAGSAMADQVVDEIRAAGGEAAASYDSVSTMEGGAAIVAKAVEAFGRLDGLINNAGILRDRTLLKMTEALWDPVIAVHLKGTFSCSLAAALQMKEQGDGGVILNTTSYAGLKGNFGQTNYAAAKAGVYGMTLVHAMELRRAGIRVNAVAPMAKTRMTDDIDLIPESMTADHVAPVAAFLVSDLAKDVTGRVFGVHGGHVFEYKMEMTQGVETGDGWTPSALAERLPEIAGEKAAAPAAPAAQAVAALPAGAPETPADQIRAIFRFMPEGFLADKAGTWKAVIVWEIAGTGDFTISVADGKCTSAEGKQGTPTCVVKTDTDTFLGIVDGSVDGNQAYMQGKISATNVGDLMKYQKVIDAKKAQAAFQASLAAAPAPAARPATKPAPAPAAPAAPAGPSPGEKALDAMLPFARLKLLLGLLPERKPADGLDAANIHLTARDLACTLTLADGKLDVAVGHLGEPTSRVVATAGGLWDLLAGKDAKALLADAKVTATSMAELRWLVATCGEGAIRELAKEVEARGTGLDRGLLGRMYHGDPLFVTRDVMLAYAAATNDDNPRHVDIGREGGVIAPPMLPVRYFNQSFFKVFTDPELHLDLSRLLFGEMALTFFEPLRELDLVAVKSRIEDIIDKDTGQILLVRSRLMCEGETKAEGLASLLSAGRARGGSGGWRSRRAPSPSPRWRGRRRC